ncbi:amino acid ABC transporter ATP-binding protein [Corticibacter populi]|uniref:Amino acid ABC transporter ATP-binding protein n=1 Tax=Corticibacter populi TaxID=1550736 RepID=A0A3M6QXL1_9BURK|nr:amino acid ABC transporter ATP-binding protein [Corticibacter populi]RMX07714.1 amino acid ABC transporter ATP-binding protein [Corticibacter populi]RZS30229.1 amino acid ABC transporter ATP-binding protein (PAAT family) [Corticibacter populi]
MAIETSPQASSAPLVRMHGVHKWYGPHHVLVDIDLELARGERIVVCGPSGSGKSTLIRCINRLEAHQQGVIEVDGVEVNDRRRNLQHVRHRVGMVFQQFNLFPHLSVLENLTLGQIWALRRAAPEARARAHAALQRVHVAALADKYPARLSGGQQQRVAIARALCLDPQVLLLDEPTSALDPEMVKEVLDVITELAAQSGVAMLCVTHEMGFARRVADRVVFMDHGRIVETNTPEQFFQAPSSPRAREFLEQILH